MMELFDRNRVVNAWNTGLICSFFSMHSCWKLWMVFCLSCLDCCGCFYVRTMRCQFELRCHLAAVFNFWLLFCTFVRALQSWNGVWKTKKWSQQAHDSVGFVLPLEASPQNCCCCNRIFIPVWCDATLTGFMQCFAFYSLHYLLRWGF